MIHQPPGLGQKFPECVLPEMPIIKDGILPDRIPLVKHVLGKGRIVKGIIVAIGIAEICTQVQNPCGGRHQLGKGRQGLDFLCTGCGTTQQPGLHPGGHGQKLAIHREGLQQILVYPRGIQSVQRGHEIQIIRCVHPVQNQHIRPLTVGKLQVQPGQVFLAFGRFVAEDGACVGVVPLADSGLDGIDRLHRPDRQYLRLDLACRIWRILHQDSLIKMLHPEVINAVGRHGIGSAPDPGAAQQIQGFLVVDGHRFAIRNGAVEDGAVGLLDGIQLLLPQGHQLAVHGIFCGEIIVNGSDPPYQLQRDGFTVKSHSTDILPIDGKDSTVRFHGPIHGDHGHCAALHLEQCRAEHTLRSSRGSILQLRHDQQHTISGCKGVLPAGIRNPRFSPDSGQILLQLPDPGGFLAGIAAR